MASKLSNNTSPGGEDEDSSLLPKIDTKEDIQAVHAAGGLTLWSTVILLVGEMAGSGVLALPRALADSGWIGVVMIALGCSIAGFNGVHLGYCWNILLERYPEYRVHVRDPYASIGEKAVGKWMRHVVSVAIYITLFGVCTLFLLLVSQNIYSVAKQAGFDFPFCIWMILIAVVLIPLSWFGSPKDFWWVAIFSASSSGMGCILIFITCMIELPNKVQSDTKVDFTSFFLAFGAIMFAYGGASTFPTIQHDMKKPEKFNVSVIIAFIILICLYIPPAISGYIVYSETVNANVLASLPEGGLRISIEVLITVHLFFAFIIALNPFAQDVEEIFKIPHTFNWKRVLLRSLIVCGILFVGESIPHFGALLSLVGGSSVTFLTFVAPSLFYLCLCSQEGEWPKRELQLYEKVLHGEIMLLGVLGGIAATISAVREIVSPNTFVPPCYINATAAAQG